jgi:hypothetical protein
MATARGRLSIGETHRQRLAGRVRSSRRRSGRGRRPASSRSSLVSCSPSRTLGPSRVARRSPAAPPRPACRRAASDRSHRGTGKRDRARPAFACTSGAIAPGCRPGSRETVDRDLSRCSNVSSHTASTSRVESPRRNELTTSDTNAWVCGTCRPEGPRLEPQLGRVRDPQALHLRRPPRSSSPSAAHSRWDTPRPPPSARS